MDELTKSAVLLSHLDASSQTKVLECLPAELRLQIERRLPEVGEIPQDDLAEIVREYQSQFHSVGSSAAENGDGASSGTLRIDPGDVCTPETLCRILQFERLELVAAVLAHLPERLAVDVFPRLPEEHRRDLIPLISRMGTVSPLVLDECGRFLREKHEPVREPHAGGMGLIARLLAGAPAGFDAVVHERLTDEERAYLARLLDGGR